MRLSRLYTSLNLPFAWNRLTQKYKCINSQFKRNHHGFSWESGTMDYAAVGSVIRDALQDSGNVYVIGDRKKKFLERFKFNAINILDLGYLQVDKSKVVHFCANHNFQYKTACSGHNVKMMKKFMNVQMQWEDISMEWEYA